jgi:hypothetical protein
MYVSADRQKVTKQTAASQGDTPMKLSLIGVGILALSSTIAFCQPGPINQRRENQQDRIAQGVRSARLNARETAHIERREASIGREEHRMRAADGGRLTHGDRIALNHRLNRTSRTIYRDKHNGARR